MPDLNGVGVSPGVGVGRVRRLVGGVPEPPPERHAGDLAAQTRETERTLLALEETAADLAARGERAGGAARDVLGAQALMARDPELVADIRSRIGSGMAGPRAVYEAFGRYRELVAQAGEYLAARVADLDDVRDRVVARLLGVPLPGIPASDEPFVLVAKDLAPADTALLDPSHVLAFVTQEGGPTSHTAILARSLGLPAVVACPDASMLVDGMVVLVDGATGQVRPDPGADEVERARSAAAARAAAVAATAGPGRTADGRPVALYANIGRGQDVEAALRHGAEGVGLYRTEFLFLDRPRAPTAAEQQIAYREVLEAFPGGIVIVRVLDAGADKPLAFLPPSEGEQNPALGERGLRLLRRNPEILTTQLRALAAASAAAAAARQASSGPTRLGVMAPMVTDVDDARWFAAACRDAGIVEEVGAMVELPVAALRARDLLDEVDFLSVGTNDLAQYACAADRQIGALTRLADPWQPALLDLVAFAAEAAHETGKLCGVCGEAAADPLLACVLVGMGVSSLSMGPAALPLVRAALSRHTQDQCVQAAAAARGTVSAVDAKTAARAQLPAVAALGFG